MLYSEEKLREYLKWDIATWQRALYHWDAVLERHLEAGASARVGGLTALEVGARDGGLTLWLCEKGIGAEVVCSDLPGPTEHAYELHRRYGVSPQVEYRILDACDLDVPDESFDVVMLKSVLGGIGEAGGYAAIEQAMSELWRVLRPDGLLLFAENQLGSQLHQLGRRAARNWGGRWYYLSLTELDGLLSRYATSQVKTYGYFSCVKNDFAPFAAMDRLVCRTSCSPRHYMAYGHAVK